MKPSLLFLGAIWLSHVMLCGGADATWPAPVPGHVPVQPGEHPRLLFRRGDLPALRQRMKTPEGQALLKRLCQQLNGGDGRSLPSQSTAKGRPAADGAGPLEKAPVGSVMTMSHVAGYGFLYQLTQDPLYARLAREAMERALEGYRDRDQRYSFRQPFGALRAGPSLGWYALGYDLAYDGWDPEFRQKVAREIEQYNEGEWCSLAELAAGRRHHPGSNHWGMQVGGAALALLAIMGDDGVNADRIRDLLKTSERSMIRCMTEGFGDGGFFAEGDGTGSMASHIVFLPALQAWRVAAGKDFVRPRPNAQWMALRWFFLAQAHAGEAIFLPRRGGYPHNVWARDTLSGGGYFGIAMGILDDDQRAAVAWYYDHFGFRAADERAGTPFDSVSPYPHHTILSFVNWCWDRPARPMDEVLPHAFHDSKWKFYAWRNRWQDENDVIISILTHTAKGFMKASAETTLSILTQKRSTTWGTIQGGFVDQFQPRPDGTTILKTGNGSCLAVDFSRASGADVMLVLAGPSAPPKNSYELHGVRFSFHFPVGPAPSIQVQADGLHVGQQLVGWDGERITLAR